MNIPYLNDPQENTSGSFPYVSMKKIVLIVALMMLNATLTLAKDLEVLTCESIIQTVMRIKKDAICANAQKDERTVTCVIDQIQKFFDQVTLEESFMTDCVRKRATCALIELRKVLAIMRRDADEASHLKSMRLSYIRYESSKTDTVYGIDMSEARKLVDDDFSHSIANLVQEAKRIKRLDEDIAKSLLRLSPPVFN